MMKSLKLAHIETGFYVCLARRFYDFKVRIHVYMYGNEKSLTVKKKKTCDVRNPRIAIVMRISVNIKKSNFLKLIWNIYLYVWHFRPSM